MSYAQFKCVKLFNKLISQWNLGFSEDLFDEWILNTIFIRQGL